MKLLDRYVFFAFWKAFLGALVVFAVLAVVFDYVGRISFLNDNERVAGTFAEGYSRLKITFLFYLAYLPYLLKQVLPFVAVAAGVTTVSNMLRRNEVMPVLAAGVSVRRLFLPVFVCGLIVCGIHFGFNELLLPALSRKHLALKRFFSGDRSKGLNNLAHLRDGRGTVTRAGFYSFSDQSLSEVVIHRPWEEAGFERWRVKRLEPDGDAWIATEGAVVLPAGIQTQPRRVPPGSRVDFGVSPDEVEALASKQGTEEIPYRDLKRLVAKFPGRRHLMVALHKQIARPLTSFVLLLVVVPILLRLSRRRYAAVLLTITLCACYFFLDIFFSSLGDRGDLPPVMAAYLPLALMFSFGMTRMATVRT